MGPPNRILEGPIQNKGIMINHYHSFDEIRLENSWATIGMFDGVHLGHQAILRPLAEQAHAAGSSVVVVTFYPHPITVLRGVSDEIYLTSPEERARLIEALGYDAVVTLPFDRALASLSAGQFMEKMTAALGLRKLWIGSDFALGRNRQGDAAALRALGEKMGFGLKVIEEVHAASSEGVRISSSAIRALVRQGQVREASQMLGRPYSLEGEIIHGDGRGRQLGFPTANIAYWPGKVIPAYGVYATWLWVDGQRLPSVSSVGVRPTFDPPGSPPRVEAFVIDYEGDLYDRVARLEFLRYLRPELRFDSAQTLIDQMNVDTLNAREVLANVS